MRITKSTVGNPELFKLRLKQMLFSPEQRHHLTSNALYELRSMDVDEKLFESLMFCTNKLKDQVIYEVSRNSKLTLEQKKKLVDWHLSAKKDIPEPLIQGCAQYIIDNIEHVQGRFFGHTIDRCFETGIDIPKELLINAYGCLNNYSTKQKIHEKKIFTQEDYDRAQELILEHDHGYIDDSWVEKLSNEKLIHYVNKYGKKESSGLLRELSDRIHKGLKIKEAE